MPLYAQMWQEKFPEPVEKVGYYSLKEGNVHWYPKKNTDMAELIREALQKTEEIITGMDHGRFPAKPGNVNECRYCYHSPVCRK